MALFGLVSCTRSAWLKWTPYATRPLCQSPPAWNLKVWRRSFLKHKILLRVPPARSKCFWADDFYHFAKLRWGWDRGLTFILIIRFLKSHIWEKLEPRRARMLQAFVAWNADNVDGLLKNERTELRMTFWHIRVVERAIDLNIWKRIHFKIWWTLHLDTRALIERE